MSDHQKWELLLELICASSPDTECLCEEQCLKYLMPRHTHSWTQERYCGLLNLLILEGSGDGSAATRTKSHHLPWHCVQLLVCQSTLLTCTQNTHIWRWNFLNTDLVCIINCISNVLFFFKIDCYAIYSSWQVSCFKENKTFSKIFVIQYNTVVDVTYGVFLMRWFFAHFKLNNSDSYSNVLRKATANVDIPNVRRLCMAMWRSSSSAESHSATTALMLSTAWDEEIKKVSFTHIL